MEWIKSNLLYLAPSFVIVEVHGCPRILPSLQGINKLLGDGLAKSNIVAAATPEPPMATWEQKQLNNSY